MHKDITLTDLITLDSWERIQNHFAEVLNVTIRTVDNEGNLITRPSNPTRICEEVLGNSASGITKCGRCLPPYFGEKINKERCQEGYQCHLGFHNYCIPVTISENDTIANVMLGPVLLGKRREPNGYRQKARELGIDPERIIDCITEIKLFTFTGIMSVVELIDDIICNIVQLGYSRMKLERIIPLPKLGKIVHKFHIDKILSALLDVSFNTTKADVGSIMLLDEDTGDLYIRIAKGLDKNIVRNTRLKMGEGIAGLAAQEKRFILLDDNVTDKRIKALLKRPVLKSSLVAPFRLNDEPLGVMNIATSDSSNRITSDKLETLHRLIELTENTISDLIQL